MVYDLFIEVYVYVSGGIDKKGETSKVSMLKYICPLYRIPTEEEFAYLNPKLNVETMICGFDRSPE